MTFIPYSLFFALTAVCSLFTLSANNWINQDPLVNLEEHAHSFILESKQIHIEGYPFAFNPSIIRWKGRLLLSFREIPDPKQTFTSHIGLQWLDENFEAVGLPQILDTSGGTTVPTRSEDARLLAINDHLYIVYSDCRSPEISRKNFRVYIGELLLDSNNETFTLHEAEGIFAFPGADDLRREKNWTPFEYEEKLLLTYSITPHRILAPVRGTQSSEFVSESRSDFNWTWGELRGSTQGLPIDDDHYLSFFHSSIPMTSEQTGGRVKMHYFAGAYLYNNKPPFEITHISPSPIIGKGFYTVFEYKPYWGSLLCVFPAGFIVDEETIWLTFGKQDHECWVSKIDKKALLESLAPCNIKVNENSTVQTAEAI